MYRRTVLVAMRPLSYQDYVDAHTLRVAAAGGQGAEQALLFSYYQLREQNLLKPRAYCNLACGYRLDAAGLVEYIFDPEGADLHQPDAAKRASIVLDARGQSELRFTGVESYEAVDVAPYQLRSNDLLHYAALTVTAKPDFFSVYNLTGSYYLANYGNANTTVIVTSAPEKTFDQYAPNESALTAKLGQPQVIGSFVLRRAGIQRYFYKEAYGNELENQPTDPTRPDSNSAARYVIGEGFIGTMREMLNLPASPGQQANHNVWTFINSRS